VQQRNGKIADTPAGREYEFSAVGFFKPGADIKPQASDNADGDRIVVNSATYEVRGVGDETGKGRVLTVYLERT
jgi:hypothetical protein